MQDPELSFDAFDPDELARHAGWIHGLARRLVRDAAAADDLVQEAFLAALRRRPRLGASLRPWLASVVRRQAAQRARGERHRRDRERAVARDPRSSDDLVERAESHRELLREVIELPDPYRSVLLLRFFDGLAPREIARRRGVPASTVRTQIERGLGRLRDRLDARGGGDGRAWALALVPLAVDGRALGAGLSTLLVPLAAMSTTVKLAGAATILAVVGLAVYRSRSEGSPVHPQGGDTSARAPAALEPPSVARADLAAPEPGPERAPAATSEQPPPAAAVDRTVHGILLDEESGQPVPYYSIELTGAAGEELVETDADGRFASVRDFRQGALTAELLDHPDSMHASFMRGRLAAYSPPDVETVEWAPGEELELRVEAGAAFRVEWTGAPQLAASDLYGELRQEVDDSYGREPVRVPVADPSLRIVRFGGLVGYVERSDPWILVLRSRDGLWSGETVVGELPRGTAPEPATVALEPTAALEVLVRRENGGPLGIEEGLWAEVRAGGEVRSGAANELGTLRGRVRESLVDVEEVRLAIGHLAGSEGVLDVHARGYETWERTVRFEEGRSTAVEVELRPLREMLRVSGELRSRSGTHEGMVTILLRDEAAGEMRSEYVELRRSEDDPDPDHDVGSELTAPFVFEQVPPGTYRMHLFSGRGARRWTGVPPVVDRSMSDLVLVFEDTEPCEDLRVEVRAAETGEPCPGTDLRCRVGDGMSLGYHRSEVVLEGVPLGSPVDIYARAPGRVPFWGDASDFTADASGAEVCVALLRPGWGARFRATDAASGAPLAGVRVLADGVELARTAADGTATVELPEPPARVALAAEGRELVETPFDPDDGSLDLARPVQEFTFR